MGLARLTGERGILSLTIILTGLIVIWAGYVKRIRWTWFVMFTIVFGWAFTELMFAVAGGDTMGIGSRGDKRTRPGPGHSRGKTRILADGNCAFPACKGVLSRGRR